MPSEILVEVYADGTGDYTNFKAAVDANKVDLVTLNSYIVFELKGDLTNTDSYVDYGGFTSNRGTGHIIIIRPIAGDECTDTTHESGTWYGTTTYIAVARSEAITFDGIEIDGWSGSGFHTNTNVIVQNVLAHGGGGFITSGELVYNTIVYDTANNAIFTTPSDKVTVISSYDVAFRNEGPITNCVGYDPDGTASNNQFYNLTNPPSDDNAGNATSNPAWVPYTSEDADFNDASNDKYNIDPGSSLFALGIGAVLGPVATGRIMSSLANGGGLAERGGIAGAGGGLAG